MAHRGGRILRAHQSSFSTAKPPQFSPTGGDCRCREFDKAPRIISLRREALLCIPDGYAVRALFLAGARRGLCSFWGAIQRSLLRYRKKINLEGDANFRAVTGISFTCGSGNRQALKGNLSIRLPVSLCEQHAASTFTVVASFRRPMSSLQSSKYPLLEEILALRQMTIQPMYTICDVANLFGVSVRAIQARVASSQLSSRDLPGRAKFLTADLEQFLRESRKGGRR